MLGLESTAHEESVSVDLDAQIDGFHGELGGVVRGAAKGAPRGCDRRRVEVQDVVATPCELSAQLDLKWMSRVVVNGDAHYRLRRIGAVRPEHGTLAVISL